MFNSFTHLRHSWFLNRQVLANVILRYITLSHDSEVWSLNSAMEWKEIGYVS